MYTFQAKPPPPPHQKKKAGRGLKLYYLKCMELSYITERFLFNRSKRASLCINSAKNLLVNNWNADNLAVNGIPWKISYVLTKSVLHMNLAQNPFFLPTQIVLYYCTCVFNAKRGSYHAPLYMQMNSKLQLHWLSMGYEIVTVWWKCARSYLLIHIIWYVFAFSGYFVDFLLTSIHFSLCVRTVLHVMYAFGNTILFGNTIRPYTLSSGSYTKDPTLPPPPPPPLPQAIWEILYTISIRGRREQTRNLGQRGANLVFRLLLFGGLEQPPVDFELIITVISSFILYTFV